MSVAEDFKQFLIGAGLGTEQNISISRTPAANLERNDQWAIVAQPGSRSGGNILQWKRNHSLLVLYRNSDGGELYNKDDQLQDLQDENGCIQLEHYKVLRALIPPMGELDLGTTEVHVGSWQITLELVKINQEES